MAVVTRYCEAPVAKCFIRGFGIQRGAIASCVGHDSHNILVVGSDQSQMCRAVNLIVQHRGGISAVCGDDERVLPLPIAGLDDMIGIFKVFTNDHSAIFESFASKLQSVSCISKITFWVFIEV